MSRPRREAATRSGPGAAPAAWRLRTRGCPACAAAREAEAASFAWFLRENYRQAETLAALAHRRFCREHLRLLLASRDAHLAATLEHLARRQSEALEAFQARALRRRLLLPAVSRWRRVPRQLQTADEPDGCQFCTGGRRAATVAVAEVLELLREDRWRAAYVASDGLCCPHAWMALCEAPAEVAGWLAAETQRRLGLAQTGIDDWYRSLRRGAPTTSAAPAWAEAAHLVWGDLAGP